MHDHFDTWTVQSENKKRWENMKVKKNAQKQSKWSEKLEQNKLRLPTEFIECSSHEKWDLFVLLTVNSKVSITYKTATEFRVDGKVAINNVTL